MKIIIGTENDIYGLFIVNKFLNELHLHEKNDVIILLTDTYDEAKTISPLSEFFKMTKFFVNDYMDIIDNLNINKKNDNNKNMLTWYDIKKLVPTYIIKSINSEDAKKHIIGSDYLFSVRLCSILNEKTIKLFNKGALNIHSGPIPKYRGLENPFYQILHKNEIIYGSLHWIDKGIDTGDLITYFNVDYRKSQLLLQPDLYLKGCELIYDFIHDSQKINININKMEKGKYYKFPKDEDIQNFLKEGNTFSTFEDWIYLSKFFINSKESTDFLKKQLNKINIK